MSANAIQKREALQREGAREGGRAAKCPFYSGEKLTKSAELAETRRGQVVLIQ